MSVKIKTEVIREVFKSMKYSEEIEDIKGGTGDFIKHQSQEEVNVFLTQFTKTGKWGILKNGDRQEFMLKLATAIENEEDSFIALEKRTRGTSAAYVRTKSLPFLVKSLRYFANFCGLVKGTGNKVHLARVSETNCLSLLGYVIGPTLAAGYRILFVTSNEFSPIIKYIELLANNVGVPEGTISVLLDNINFNSMIKYSDLVAVFEETKLSNKKIISIIPNLMPIIIFDNSDLDSACESVINATWNNNYIFNCTANEVFVQETIYKQFVKKLKEKIISSNNFDTNSDKVRNSLKNLISKAEINGIEIVPPIKSDTKIGKIAFVGGRISDKDCRTIPFVSVTAFRNIDEGIALANNNTQGLSASVWTENIGLANYVAQKLDVSNVWINCFGIYSPEVAFTPRKYSGKGYFGGYQGFNEVLRDSPAVEFQGIKTIVKGSEKLFTNAIDAAKKAAQSWGSLTRFVRISKFQKIIDCIETMRSNIKSKSITEDWLNDWKLLYNEYIESNFNYSLASPVNGYNLNVIYEARGVLAMETTNTVENHNKKLLIASILEGNTLVLINEHTNLQNFYNEFSKQLPSGVLNVVPFFDAASVVAAKNSMVEYYFNEYLIDGNLECSNKFTTVTELWSDIHSKVTFVKNVWSNIGQK